MRYGVRPETLQLGGWARQRDRHARLSVFDQDCRSTSRQPERDSAGGKGRLLADPRAELRQGPVETRRHGTGESLDLSRERLVDLERPSESACQKLHGAVVVGRPEAAGDDTEIRFDGFEENGSQRVGPVPHEEDPLRLEPELRELTREKGPVQVPPVSTGELAPGDDDDGPRS